MPRIGLAVVFALSLVLAPLAAEAQQAGKIYRIGWLNQGLHQRREASWPSAMIL